MDINSAIAAKAMVLAQTEASAIQNRILSLQNNIIQRLAEAGIVAIGASPYLASDLQTIAANISTWALPNLQALYIQQITNQLINNNLN